MEERLLSKEAEWESQKTIIIKKHETITKEEIARITDNFEAKIAELQIQINVELEKLESKEVEIRKLYLQLREYKDLKIQKAQSDQEHTRIIRELKNSHSKDIETYKILIQSLNDRIKILEDENAELTKIKRSLETEILEHK
jgi:hypothetical protein